MIEHVMKIEVLWEVMLCRWVCNLRHFEWSYYLLEQGQVFQEQPSPSLTAIILRTVGRYTPNDTELHPKIFAP